MNKIVIATLIVILICHLCNDTYRENLTARKKEDEPYYTLDENKNIILIPRAIGSGIGDLPKFNPTVPTDYGNPCRGVDDEQHGILKFGQTIDKDISITGGVVKKDGTLYNPNPNNIPRMYYSGRSGPMSLDGIKCKLQTYTPLTEADNKAAARTNIDLYMPNNGRPGIPSTETGAPAFSDPQGFARPADPSVFGANDGTIPPKSIKPRALNPLPPEKVLPRTATGDGTICSKSNTFDGQVFSADAFRRDLKNLNDLKVKTKLLI